MVSLLNSTLVTTVFPILSTARAAVSSWWRDAVIYQIYPRSFADSNGDGIGDLPGITARLVEIAELGVDAIWLSPFMTSPQRDAGYDVADYCDVDPLFGTLNDFDLLLNRSHELGMRVIVDLVPNHCSSEHPWFQAALATPVGSAERDHFIFRDGRGDNGDLPPNNWESVFGGPAWTRVMEPDGSPGQWYLHLFDSSQPDLNWANRWVHERFAEILKFWLNRGVDGFRVDVAHGLSKAEGLPDFRRDDVYWNTPPELRPENPYFGHEGVHALYRAWRSLMAEYGPDRILCAEAFVEPLNKMALWVRDDEMHQAFNFPFLVTRWNGAQIRHVIDESLAAFGAVGAPSTWVLSNHDQVRHATRLALDPAENVADRITGIGPLTEPKPDRVLGLRRARAATAMMLALPGVAYLYQGEELGLPEAVDIPDDYRQDPTFFRTNGEAYGRDGCRVPIPWEADRPSFGFGPNDNPWLPQPEIFGEYARGAQRGVAESTLELYRRAISLRAELGLGTGDFEWLDSPEGVLAFRNRDVRVYINYNSHPVPLPDGELLLESQPLLNALEPETTVWIRDAD